MKVKAKLSAFTVILLMSAGALIGCGQDPEPTTEYNVFCSEDAEKYTVNGLKAKYAAGTSVAFTITENDPDNYKVTSVTSSNVSITTVSALSYSFTMPENDVRIAVQTKAVDKYAVQIDQTDIKVGDNVIIKLNLGMSEVTNITVEKAAGETKDCTISENVVVFNEKGTFSLKITDVDRGAVAFDAYQIEVRDVKKGETEDNPFTAEDAVEEGHKLEISWNKGSGNKEDHPSESFYWIKDEVTKIVEISESNKNATFWMGDFEVYRVRTEDDSDLSKLKSISIGSVVTVYGKIQNFGSQGAAKETGTVETYNVSPDFASIKKVDNSVLKEIKLSETEVFLSSGKEFQLEATLLPNGGQTISWASDNKAVATVDENGLISAVTDGTAVITASVGDVSATCKVIVSATTKVFRTIGAEELDETAEYKLATKSDTQVYAKSVMDSYYIGVSDARGDGATATIVKDGDKVSVKLDGKFVGYEYGKGDDGNYHHNISLVDAGDAKIAKFTYGDDFKLKLVGGDDAKTEVALTYYKSTMSFRSGDSDPKFAIYGYAEEAKVTSVTLSEDDVTISVGATKTISFNVNPSYASYEEVVWDSSDKAVATVADGKISALKEGTTEVTVTVDGVVSNVCTVTVEPKPTGQVTATFDMDDYAAANKISSNGTMMPDKGKDVAIDDVASFKIDGDAGSNKNTGKFYKGTAAGAQWTVRLYSSENATLTVSVSAGHVLESVKINVVSSSESKDLYNDGVDVDLTIADNVASFSSPSKSAIYSITVVYH